MPGRGALSRGPGVSEAQWRLTQGRACAAAGTESGTGKAVVLTAWHSVEGGFLAGTLFSWPPALLWAGTAPPSSDTSPPLPCLCLFSLPSSDTHLTEHGLCVRHPSALGHLATHAHPHPPVESTLLVSGVRWPGVPPPPPRSLQRWCASEALCLGGSRRDHSSRVAEGPREKVRLTSARGRDLLAGWSSSRHCLSVGTAPE